MESAGQRLILGWKHRLERLSFNMPIIHRLLIGNSLVILFGAIGGTLLTRHLAFRAGLELILLFAFLGILLTLLINGWIVKTALRPLHELREAVDRVQAGRGTVDASLIQDADPDIRRLAEAINSMLARLEGRALQLRALSERAINAQEEERKRIARSLHDDTGQSLSLLIIQLDRLEPMLPGGLPEVRQRLAATRQLATRTLEELRKVVYGLRPTMLDDLGLVPAIRWYARTSLEDSGVRVEFDSFDEATRLPPELETTLFRIAQEAISNVARHADAGSVSIGLRRNDVEVCLEVQDDGRGFNVEQIKGQALRLRRLGLLGIQERADLVGGAVSVDSATGCGTRLMVRIPLLRAGGEGHG